MNPARPALACLALLAACGVSDRTERRWIGPLTPTAATPRCQPTRGVLILRAGRVTFAPDEGTWVLDGTAGPNAITATRSRQTPDHKLYRTELQAEWTQAAINGTYTTPECTYSVNLTSY